MQRRFELNALFYQNCLVRKSKYKSLHSIFLCLQQYKRFQIGKHLGPLKTINWDGEIVVLNPNLLSLCAAVSLLVMTPSILFNESIIQSDSRPEFLGR